MRCGGNCVTDVEHEPTQHVNPAVAAGIVSWLSVQHSLMVVCSCPVISSAVLHSAVRGRKLRRGLGAFGVFVLVGAVVILCLAWQVFQFHRSTGLSFPPQFVIDPLILAAMVLIPIVIGWGRYPRSESTRPCSEVIGPLMTSAEEFCLILRPFGGDGEIVLPHRMFGASTIEQAIARSARKVAGLATYAIVDQQRRLAPPGPVFVRAARDEWQEAVSTLIGRAHSIVLILPPGQEIRKSFRWEIDQITQRCLQSRVIIVLPPERLYQHDFPKCFHYACIVAAALEGFAGSIEDVDPLKVHDLEVTIHAHAHLVKYVRPTVHHQGTLTFWMPRQRRLRRGRRFYARFYHRALTAAFRSTERELSGLGFRARYPQST